MDQNQNTPQKTEAIELTKDKILPEDLVAIHSSVLLVEDETFIRGLLMRHLKRDGLYNIDEANNGEEALELLRTKAYDLIITDIQMPIMDGLSLLKEIKSDPNLRHVPVIVVSGISEIHLTVECINLGAEDHILKPFEPLVLKARVFSSLEKKKMQDREKVYLSQIFNEKKNVDDLLNVILPATVAEELKQFGFVKPRAFDCVAILFCDVVNFTTYCNFHTPDEVVSKLQTLFELFEKVILKHKMEKIKTIGDAFMAAAGLVHDDPDPFATVIQAAVDLLEATKQSNTGWDVRIGIHEGPVVAGVVGSLKYQYDVWGDTVNMASHLTTQANPGAIALFPLQWERFETLFQGKSLGIRKIKGKGDIEIIECTAKN